MKVIMIVFGESGAASLKNLDGDWWCGEFCEWVHETSPYWACRADCRNELFRSSKVARAFVREKGWKLAGTMQE